jgi:hypothetical protein
MRQSVATTTPSYNIDLAEMKANDFPEIIIKQISNIVSFI